MYFHFNSRFGRHRRGDQQAMWSSTVGPGYEVILLSRSVSTIILPAVPDARCGRCLSGAVYTLAFLV